MSQSSHNSASANQSKAEPHPPGAADRGGDTPGAGDPQSGRSAPGGAPHTGLDGDAAPGTSEELPVVQGLHVPKIPEPDPRT